MRKLFALTLAVAMVLSLASVAFAVPSPTIPNPTAAKGTGIRAISDTYLYKFDGDLDSGRGEMVVTTQTEYGKTYYYPLLTDGGLLVGASDAIKSVKPKSTWDMGADAVSKVEIVKKKYQSTATVSDNYGYFLAVTFKDAVSTSSTDVAGKITLKKTSGDWATGTSADREVKANVGFSVGYALLVNENTITDGNKTFKFDGVDGEYDFDFAKLDGARYTVDVTGQGKIVLKADAKYDAAIAAKYPLANLDFFNGNGASFNKIGELLIPAAEGSYLYGVKEDGTLAKVTATYDDYEEGFLVKTRTLGRYVISDMELDLAATAPGVDVVPGTPSVTPPSVVTPSNPGTGAAA